MAKSRRLSSNFSKSHFFNRRSPGAGLFSLSRGDVLVYAAPACHE